MIWTGSDDGLVHVTRDGGKNWDNVTPKDMPEWIQINAIEASPFDAGTAYVAATCTSGTTSARTYTRPPTTARRGRRSSTAFPTSAFTRVVREDPNHKGLLVAGTEFGMYISYDDGDNWKPFKLNMPVTPITDVAFQKREEDLVVATQGRAF